jgi:sirohydrochlorin ferrochelatase
VELTLLPKGLALRKEFIDPIPMEQPPFRPPCLLFDNGSLRPESTISLRTIARRLQEAIDVEVQAVSLLHSSALPPGDLGGEPARLLEPALDAWLAGGGGEIVLVPLFFGPSAALMDYLPRRLECLRQKHPGMRVRLAQWLVDCTAANDGRIASILADNVRATIAAHGLESPAVVLVDHGSPQRAVVEVRDFLAGQVAMQWSGAVSRLAAASMERRAGPEYDFCEPLLRTVLRRPEFGESKVVVAQQFLSPGRHAGPGGDVTGICAEAEQELPRLKTYRTGLIGADPRLIQVLRDRYREACGRALV